MPITLNGTNGIIGGIGSATAQNSTSGTSIDFTGIPAGVKRITVMFDGVSTNGSGNYLIQIGDSGGVETSGYIGYAVYAGNGTTGGATATNGYILNGGTPGTVWVIYGTVVITLLNASTNTWTASVCLGMYNGSSQYSLTGGGSKPLSATLDRVRITTSNGTDTFDAGSINILYE